MVRRRSGRSFAHPLWLGALVVIATACLGQAYQETAQKAKALVPVHETAVSVEYVPFQQHPPGTGAEGPSFRPALPCSVPSELFVPHMAPA